MRRSILCCVLLCLLLLGPWVGPRAEHYDPRYPYAPDLAKGPFETIRLDGRSYLASARSTLAMLNAVRTAYGSPPLELDATLEAAAMQRAAETSVLWAHCRPDGSYMYIDQPPVDSENIAAGNTAPAKVFAQWTYSKGHFDNMINPLFRSVGIGAYGTALGEAPRWWSQVFSIQPARETPGPVEDGTPYNPEIRINPKFMRYQIRPLDDRFVNWGNGLDEAYVYRKEPLQRGQFLLLGHYKVEDGYAEPTLLDMRDIRFESTNTSLLKVLEDREFQTLGEGNLKVRAYRGKTRLTELPVELRARWEIPLRNRYLAEESEGLLAELRNVAAKTKTYDKGTLLQNADGEWVAAKKLQQDGQLKRNLDWDSHLELYALRMLRLNSLGILPDGNGVYPEQRLVDSLLDLGAHYAWHVFSDQDTAEDRQLNVPEWAQSCAAVRFKNDYSTVTFIVYSDLQGDGLKLSEREILRQLSGSSKAMAAQTDNHVETLKWEQSREDLDLNYSVGIFADKFAFGLTFAEGEKVKLQPEESTGTEELRYSVHPVLRCTLQKGRYPVVQPDVNKMAFSSSDPEVAKVLEPGVYRLQNDGTTELGSDLPDALTGALRAHAKMQLTVDLPNDRTMGVQATTLAAPTTPEPSGTVNSKDTKNTKNGWSPYLFYIIISVLGCTLMPLYFLLRLLFRRRRRNATAPKAVEQPSAEQASTEAQVTEANAEETPKEN